MPIEPYALRFEPFFRDYLWGGRNLHARLGKPIPQTGVWAESWELVDHTEHDSRVTNGPLAGRTLGQLVREQPEWLLGPNLHYQQFPLLLKYLDCQRVLSIQVHPDDAYAQRLSPPDLGKTEAWYVVHAEPEAVIYAGLRPGVDRDALAAAISAGRAEECLHKIAPRPGDCVFIPAGTVHALGAGLVVAEIQQASNTTFRLYDWNRVDAAGQPRPLHIEQSLETINYQAGPRAPQRPIPIVPEKRERLVACDKFLFDRLLGRAPVPVGGDDHFHILSVPRGSATFRGRSGDMPLNQGETVLLPAALGQGLVELSDDAVVLDVTLPA
jgi:mannose-6-phosphate isomerase